MATSAIRRHHRNRLIERWVREHPVGRAEVQAQNEAEYRFISPRIFARTRKVCSCYICQSGRRKYGNGRAALTFQELRAIDRMAVQVGE